MPEGWANGPERRKEAGIPGQVQFKKQAGRGDRRVRAQRHNPHSIAALRIQIAQ
ncbi:MAG: hypothetical protein ABI165_12115 [Bryobacteraceae bacterium]